MATENKTFILSDETTNSYGFKVITAGIDMTRFQKNPVMFYNHNRELGVIGRWENLRIEGTRLLADPLFDDTDELGIKIRSKVEKGFIKSASVGIEIIEAEGEVVTKCILHECSVVDIPSNQNALTLYDKSSNKVNDPRSFLLSIKLIKSEGMDLLQKLVKLLGLDNPTEEAVISAVQDLIETQRHEVVKNRLNLALTAGMINKDSFVCLSEMAMKAPAAFNSYMDQLENNHKANLQLKVDTYFKEHPKKFHTLVYSDRDALKKFALQDYETFVQVADLLPDRKYLSEMIVNSSLRPRVSSDLKTLSDYRKHAPEELRRNPELYQRLLEEEMNKHI